MHFDPSRLQKGKAGSRLKEAVEISKMGEEIEKMTEKNLKNITYT